MYVALRMYDYMYVEAYACVCTNVHMQVCMMYLNIYKATIRKHIRDL